MTSIFRLANFLQHEPDDNTWNSVNRLIWTVVEPAMYLISACLPALRPLFSRFSTLISVPTLQRRKAFTSNDSSASNRAAGIPLSATNGLAPKSPNVAVKGARFERLEGEMISGSDDCGDEGDEGSLVSPFQHELNDVESLPREHASEPGTTATYRDQV